MPTVIMAGGFGSRLRPLTEGMPKPMLPVQGRPLLQRIIEQLGRAGITEIYISTFYAAERITDYFGDGSGFGVHLHYVRETEPLGTAGPLGLVPATGEPLLVINGDLLTSLNFATMLQHHRQQQSALTMAVYPYEVRVPYGVVHTVGALVVSLREKPTFDFQINAGIYVMQPEVHARLLPLRRINMSELIGQLLEEDLPIAQFRFDDYWLDIGRMADYERAQEVDLAAL